LDAICLRIFRIDGRVDGWMDGWMGGTRALRQGATLPPGTQVGVQGPETGNPSQAATNSPMPGQTHEAHSLDSTGSSNATTCDGTHLSSIPALHLLGSSNEIMPEPRLRIQVG